MAETDNNLKKAQPVSADPVSDGSGSDSGAEKPVAHTNAGNFVAQAKDFAGSAANTAGGAMKNAFYSAKNSWFGIRPVTVAISNGVGKAASFMNISKKSMGIALAVILLGGGSAGVIGLVNYQHQQLIFKQEDYYDPCADELADAEKGKKVTTAPGDVNAQVMENAKIAWALGKAYGMTDEQCAGMLGNMQQESGFDPYSVEAIFDEPFQIGPRKAALFTSDFNNITPAMEEWTKALPGKYSVSINLEAYRFSDGRYCAGLGLIGFTGPSAEDLMATAASEGKEWFDYNIQLAEMISGGEHNSWRFNKFLQDDAHANSVDDATAAWYGYMERGMDHPVYDTMTGGFTQRARYAHDWYERLSPMSNQIAREYGDVADDVMALVEKLNAAHGAGVLTRKAAGKHADMLSEECGLEEEKYDNSSLAAAAVAYAWPTREDGRCNNGTQLYQEVHDAVAPGDPWYQSCDRGVTTAVRWSGADDNMDMGACTNIMAHCVANPDLWDDLGVYGSSITYDQLEPGDILCGPHHVHMYTGYEEIAKKYPDAPSDYNTVSASIGDQQRNGGPGTGTTSRSPGCCNGIGPSNIENMSDWGVAHIYRYKGDYSGALKNAYTGNASGTS